MDFFYNLTNRHSTFEKLKTPNEILNKQANYFYHRARYVKEFFGTKDSSVESLSYTNTRYLVSENGNLADVDILLSATTYFNDNIRSRRNNNNNSRLDKENISFQVEYKDSKCSLIQTNFFEIVQKDNIEDSKSNSVISFIFFIVMAIILSIVIFVIWLIIKLTKKILGKK